MPNRTLQHAEYIETTMALIGTMVVLPDSETILPEITLEKGSRWYDVVDGDNNRDYVATNTIGNWDGIPVIAVAHYTDDTRTEMLYCGVFVYEGWQQRAEDRIHARQHQPTQLDMFNGGESG